MKIIESSEFERGIVPGPKQVVLVSCGKLESPNIITISYVGQLSDNLMYIGVRPSRYSNGIIRQEKKFGINYIDEKFAKEADYCGIYSGKFSDKFKECGFNMERGNIDVPLVYEAKLSLECELDGILEVGKHDIFIGKVKSARKRAECTDWLFHDELNYFGKEGVIGRVFDIGKQLRKN